MNLAYQLANKPYIAISGKIEIIMVNYTNTYVEKSKKIRHKSKLVKVRINNKKSIDLRLKRIVLMMTAGHWEVDTILG